MCNHTNIVHDTYGASTCADCCMHFGQSLCSDYNSNHTILSTKSSFKKTLEKYGIFDHKLVKDTEEIFNKVSKNKVVKGNHKLSLLCASLYYAYYYRETPKTFDDLTSLFNIDHKTGIKGLKTCQIIIQESCVKDPICLYNSSHKNVLKDLIQKLNIPLKHYTEIENLIEISHHQKKKFLTDKINSLWLSCIFFWILQKNPDVCIDDFLDISCLKDISSHQIKSDLSFLNKIFAF